MNKDVYLPHVVVNECGDLYIYEEEDSKQAEIDWGTCVCFDRESIPKLLNSLSKIVETMELIGEALLEQRRALLLREIAEKQAQLDALG